MNKYFLFLFLGLIICGCNDKSVQPEESRQYKIAFNYSDSSSVILAMVNKDGSNFKTVHRLMGTSFFMRWSPDGSKLAFDVYSVNVGVVNIDGSGFKLFPDVLAGFYGEYSWFEDSKRIAFSRNDTIYSIDVVANTQKFIELGASPEVSPSGDKIAFLRNSSLYLVNADGTGEFHLIDSVYAGFKWSPNGNMIAFVNSDGALSLIRRDGSGKIQLTPEASVNTRISWSPDGSQLTYGHVYGIGVVNADGTENKLIAINADFPDWCGNGFGIIYNSSATGLIMIKPDGTDSTQIISLKPDFSISWSPLPLP
jgi:Tol biopolymer transport system component